MAFKPTSDFKTNVLNKMREDANQDPDPAEPIDIDDDSVDLDNSGEIGDNIEGGEPDPGETKEGSASEEIMDLVNQIDSGEKDPDKPKGSDEPKAPEVPPVTADQKVDDKTEIIREILDTDIVKRSDGTSVTVADLKAGEMMRADYSRKTKEVATERDQLRNVLQKPENLIRYFREEAGIDLAKLAQDKSEPELDLSPPEGEEYSPVEKKLVEHITQLSLQNRQLQGDVQKLGGSVKDSEEVIAKKKNEDFLNEVHTDFSRFKEETGLTDGHFSGVFALLTQGKGMYGSKYQMANAVNDFLKVARTVPLPKDHDFSTTLEKHPDQEEAVYQKVRARKIKEKEDSIANFRSPSKGGSPAKDDSGSTLDRPKKSKKRGTFAEHKQQLVDAGVIEG